MKESGYDPTWGRPLLCHVNGSGQDLRDLVELPRLECVAHPLEQKLILSEENLIKAGLAFPLFAWKEGEPIFPALEETFPEKAEVLCLAFLSTKPQPPKTIGAWIGERFKALVQAAFAPPPRKPSPSA